MDLCKRVLMFEEGFSETAYFCTAGARTVGYGHNLDANHLHENDYAALGLSDALPLRLTKAQGEALLVRDMNKIVIPAAHRLFGADHWVTMGEVRRAALGSMIYQLGERGLAQFKDLRSAVLRYDWNGAADAAADSRWAGQTPERARRHVAAIGTGRNAWKGLL